MSVITQYCSYLSIIKSDLEYFSNKFDRTIKLSKKDEEDIGSFIKNSIGVETTDIEIYLDDYLKIRVIRKVSLKEYVNFVIEYTINR